MELTSRILGLQIAFHREVGVALKAFPPSINYALAQTQPRQESKESPDIPHVPYSNMSHIPLSHPLGCLSSAPNPNPNVSTHPLNSFIPDLRFIVCCRLYKPQKHKSH